LVDHRLALDRIKENIRITDFNKAAATFRAAFVDAQVLLRQNIISVQSLVTNIISDQVLIEHEKAKILFEPFIDDAHIVSFNDAWEKYKDYDNRYTIEVMFPSGRQYRNQLGNEEQKLVSEYCLTHMEGLLSYANRK
jgi:hypothetical protein